MDRSLSEQQETLLFMAVKNNGGIVSMQMAEQLYSSKSSAKSAVNKLRMFDYVELKTPGYFRVVKLPRSVKEEIEKMNGDEEEDSSEFEAEPV